MNYARKTLISNAVFIIIGLAALLFSIFGDSSNAYRGGMLSGLAGGCLVVGIGGIVVSARLMKNPKRAKEVEIANSEERSQFIRMSANSLVHTIMIFVESIGAAVAGLMGFKEISVTLAGVLIIQVILYISSLYYYGKKY